MALNEYLTNKPHSHSHTHKRSRKHSISLFTLIYLSSSFFFDSVFQRISPSIHRFHFMHWNYDVSSGRMWISLWPHSIWLSSGNSIFRYFDKPGLVFVYQYLYTLSVVPCVCVCVIPVCVYFMCMNANKIGSKRRNFHHPKFAFLWWIVLLANNF